MNELQALFAKVLDAVTGGAVGPLGALPDAARSRLEAISDGTASAETFGADPADAWLARPGFGAVLLAAEIVRKARTILAPRLMPAGWDTLVAGSHQDATATLAQDHPDFVFPVVAGGVYAVEAFLVYSANHATGDFAYRLAVSAGAMTGVGHSVGDSTSDGGIVVRAVANSAAESTAFAHGAAADLTAPRIARGDFAFRVTADATCRLRFGQVLAGPGRVSRLAAGSYLRWKRIA